MTAPLDDWLAAQEAASARAIEAAISATHLSHRRPGFGATVVPAAGSVLASPVGALWDPEPDYFYHWVRDAGVVMLAAAHLRERDAAAWDRRFADYVAFSLSIATRTGPAANPWRATTDAAHARFLRADADLAGLTGEALLAEPRANADGSPDFEDWNRPQFDGPALAALSLLAWPGPAPDGHAALLDLNLAHVLAHAAEPCIGPWEDPPPARHAFTMLAQRAALLAAGDRLDAAARQTALARLDRALDELWDVPHAHLRASSAAPAGESDANIVLGALLAEHAAGPFGIADPRIAATAAHVTRWSLARFPATSPAAPLVGRWPSDAYFGGHPWLPTSLGFAEFHYRRAADPTAAPTDRRAAWAEAERFLTAVRAVAPRPGPLSEQVDGTTGAPVSCRDLTWSHAALIAAAHARRKALA